MREIRSESKESSGSSKKKFSPAFFFKLKFSDAKTSDPSVAF